METDNSTVYIKNIPEDTTDGVIIKGMLRS